MAERAWELEVADKLGKLVQATSDLAEQVRRQNGNVARLWAEMDKVKQHPNECVLRGQVIQIEKEMTAHRASRVAVAKAVIQIEKEMAAHRAARAAVAKATAPWHRWAERIAWVVLGASALLVLRHGPELLEVFKGAKQ